MAPSSPWQLVADRDMVKTRGLQDRTFTLPAHAGRPPMVAQHLSVFWHPTKAFCRMDSSLGVKLERSEDEATGFNTDMHARGRARGPTQARLHAQKWNCRPLWCAIVDALVSASSLDKMSSVIPASITGPMFATVVRGMPREKGFRAQEWLRPTSKRPHPSKNKRTQAPCWMDQNTRTSAATAKAPKEHATKYTPSPDGHCSRAPINSRKDGRSRAWSIHRVELHQGLNVTSGVENRCKSRRRRIATAGSLLLTGRFLSMALLTTHFSAREKPWKSTKLRLVATCNSLDTRQLT